MALHSQEIITKDVRLADVLNQLTKILQELKFGSVEIVVHEGRVVQLERREKLRFDGK